MSQQGVLPHVSKSDEMEQSILTLEPEILKMKLIDRHYKN